MTIEMKKLTQDMESACINILDNNIMPFIRTRIEKAYKKGYADAIADMKEETCNKPNDNSVNASIESEGDK